MARVEARPGVLRLTSLVAAVVLLVALGSCAHPTGGHPSDGASLGAVVSVAPVSSPQPGASTGPWSINLSPGSPISLKSGISLTVRPYSAHLITLPEPSLASQTLIIRCPKSNRVVVTFWSLRTGRNLRPLGDLRAWKTVRRGRAGAVVVYWEQGVRASRLAVAWHSPGRQTGVMIAQLHQRLRSATEALNRLGATWRFLRIRGVALPR